MYIGNFNVEDNILLRVNEENCIIISSPLPLPTPPPPFPNHPKPPTLAKSQGEGLQKVCNRQTGR